MERTEENTEKLMEFFDLYNSLNNKKIDITEEYVWKKFDGLRKYKSTDGNFKDFVEASFFLDPMFKNRTDENIDFSFLKEYPPNIQELLVKQILLDFRKTWSDPLTVFSYFFSKDKDSEPKMKVKSNRDINNDKREDLYKLINNIDEYILVLKFFLNPPHPIKRDIPEENQEEKVVTDEEVQKILSSI